MNTNRPRHSVACRWNILAVPALAALLLAGTAGASPIRSDGYGGAALADATSKLLAPAGDVLSPTWTRQNAVGVASAVSQTLHAMAVGAVSGEPSYRSFSPVPLSSAPLPVPEPAAIGLLAAGCLVLAAAGRRRPAPVPR